MIISISADEQVWLKIAEAILGSGLQADEKALLSNGITQNVLAAKQKKQQEDAELAKIAPLDEVPEAVEATEFVDAPEIEPEVSGELIQKASGELIQKVSKDAPEDQQEA